MVLGVAKGCAKRKFILLLDHLIIRYYSIHPAHLNGWLSKSVRANLKYERGNSVVTKRWGGNSYVVIRIERGILLCLGHVDRADLDEAQMHAANADGNLKRGKPLCRDISHSFVCLLCHMYIITGLLCMGTWKTYEPCRPQQHV